MKTWEQLYHDVVSVGILRDQVHKVIVQVGQQSFTKPAEKVDKPPVQARIARGEVVPFQPTEVDCSSLARRWNFPEAQQIIDWLRSTVDPCAPVKFLSWFQLSILFEHQTKLAGISYKPSSKRYFLAPAVGRKNFVKRTNNLSRWIQGVYPQCKVLHVRPNSVAITFWTMCIALPAKQHLVELMDALLSQHQPTFSKVRELCAL